MKIENDLTNQAANIDTSVIRNKLSRIETFIIYDDFLQSHIPDDNGIPSFKAMTKKQNVNAWFAKCNYLINYIKKDFEKCLELIEGDKDLFVGFRISEKREILFIGRY